MRDVFSEGLKPEGCIPCVIHKEYILSSVWAKTRFGQRLLQEVNGIPHLVGSSFIDSTGLNFRPGQALTNCASASAWLWVNSVVTVTIALIVLSPQCNSQRLLV
jgi:hypothetical protein